MLNRCFDPTYYWDRVGMRKSVTHIGLRGNRVKETHFKKWEKNNCFLKIELKSSQDSHESVDSG